jgi:hypothetical protein
MALALWTCAVGPGWTADLLLGVQSARVMSQSMPWSANEIGIFRKYSLEFPLVYIGTSPLATAAMLGGDAQLLIEGGVGLVRTPLSGNSELVYSAGIKNYLTQSILAQPEINLPCRTITSSVICTRNRYIPSPPTLLRSASR